MNEEAKKGHKKLIAGVKSNIKEFREVIKTTILQ